jgi:hypothetical protein
MLGIACAAAVLLLGGLVGVFVVRNVRDRLASAGGDDQHDSGGSIAPLITDVDVDRDGKSLLLTIATPPSDRFVLMSQNGTVRMEHSYHLALSCGVLAPAADRVFWTAIALSQYQVVGLDVSSGVDKVLMTADGPLRVIAVRPDGHTVYVERTQMPRVDPQAAKLTPAGLLPWMLLALDPDTGVSKPLTPMLSRREQGAGGDAPWFIGLSGDFTRAFLACGPDIVAWPLGKTSGTIRDAQPLFRFPFGIRTAEMTGDGSACAALVSEGPTLEADPTDYAAGELRFADGKRTRTVAKVRGLWALSLSTDKRRLAWGCRTGKDQEEAELHIYDIVAQHESTMLQTPVAGKLRGVAWLSPGDVVVWGGTQCYRWHIPDREMKLIYDVNAAKATP